MPGLQKETLLSLSEAQARALLSYSGVWALSGAATLARQQVTSWLVLLSQAELDLIPPLNSHIIGLTPRMLR